MENCIFCKIANANIPTKRSFYLQELLQDSSAWWGMVDSNHRRRCQQIYSLSPLATREIPHIKLELVDGFEPPTC